MVVDRHLRLNGASRQRDETHNELNSKSNPSRTQSDGAETGWRESQERNKRTVRDRYVIGVLAPSCSTGAETMTLVKQASLLFDMGDDGT